MLCHDIGKPILNIAFVKCMVTSLVVHNVTKARVRVVTLASETAVTTRPLRFHRAASRQASAMDEARKNKWFVVSVNGGSSPPGRQGCGRALMLQVGGHGGGGTPSRAS
jgi:hypothetical protein